MSSMNNNPSAMGKCQEQPSSTAPDKDTYGKKPSLVNIPDDMEYSMARCREFCSYSNHPKPVIMCSEGVAYTYHHYLADMTARIERFAKIAIGDSKVEESIQPEYSYPQELDIPSDNEISPSSKGTNETLP